MSDQLSLFPESDVEPTKSSADPILSAWEKNRSALDEHFRLTRACHDGEEYLNLLNFITRFPQYSPFNCYLIYIQNPWAGYVATPYQWEKRFERRVKERVAPIVILAPMSPVLFVYDVADTEGKPFPSTLTVPLDTRGRISSSIWDRTVDNCARDLVKVYEKDDSSAKIGSARVLEEKELVRISDQETYEALYAIQIAAKQSVTKKYSALVRELGSLYSGHLGADKKAWWEDRRNYDATGSQREMEAESIGYLVCKRQKIETDSAKYLASYIQKAKKIPDFSLEIVLRVTGHIENMGKRVVKKRNKKR